MLAFNPGDKTLSIVYCDKGRLVIEAVNCSIFVVPSSTYSFKHRLRYPVNHTDNPQHILCWMWCTSLTRGVNVL